MSRARSRLALFLAVAAIACLSGPARAADTQPLGRLFTSPDWRAKLERQRQLNIQEARSYEGGSVRLDGVVVRSSGRSTVWLNGQPQTETDANTGVAATPKSRQPGEATVAVGTEPAAELKVGATLNRATHETTGGLSAGEIRIHRSAAKK